MRILPACLPALRHPPLPTYEAVALGVRHVHPGQGGKAQGVVGQSALSGGSPFTCAGAGGWLVAHSVILSGRSLMPKGTSWWGLP